MLRINRPSGFAVFNRAGDKSTAQKEWRARFENRTLPKELPAAKVIEVKASTLADTTEILVYDEIGMWGITAKDFVAALATINTPNIVVRINSPGGDVFDGLAIYNALMNHKANITCVVDGLAASAASFIALAGDTVSIHESAMMMIHRAWGFAIGNQADMADMVTVLSKIDSQLAGIYAKQTGKSVEEMAALMVGESDGTWFTAQEAADLNLVDEIVVPGEGQDPTEEDDPEAQKAMARVKAMRRRLALADHD